VVLDEFEFSLAPQSGRTLVSLSHSNHLEERLDLLSTDPAPSLFHHPLTPERANGGQRSRLILKWDYEATNDF